MTKEIIYKRLALVKYLYQQGIETSYKADAIAGFSVLNFHDAVEMFFLVALEHSGTREQNKPNAKSKLFLMDFFELLPNATMKTAINSLNLCRNAIKHNGQFPSKIDIEKHRVNVGQFFSENCKEFFDVDFETVSLIDLVSFPKTHSFLTEAQNNLNNESFYECLAECSKAFDCLLREYNSNKIFEFDSIFEIGDKSDKSYERFVNDVSLNDNAARRNKQWFERASKTINELRDLQQLMIMGVDCNRYVLFDTVTPDLYYWEGEDKYDVHCSQQYLEERVFINKETCEMCISFIIDTALQFQNTDFDVSKYVKKIYNQ